MLRAELQPEPVQFPCKPGPVISPSPDSCFIPCRKFSCNGNGLSTKDWLRALGIKDNLGCIGPSRSEPAEKARQTTIGSANEELDLATQCAPGRRRRSRRCSIFHARDGRSAATGNGDAGADRRGEEGRQGHLLHLDRFAGRGETGQGVRGEISGHCGARRTHRRRAPVPAHRPGIFQQHPRRRYRELVRCRAFHRLEARRRSGALRAGRRRKILSGRAQGSRMASLRASASGSASSPTTPIW